MEFIYTVNYEGTKALGENGDIRDNCREIKQLHEVNIGR